MKNTLLLGDWIENGSSGFGTKLCFESVSFVSLDGVNFGSFENFEKFENLSFANLNLKGLWWSKNWNEGCRVGLSR